MGKLLKSFSTWIINWYFTCVKMIHFGFVQKSWLDFFSEFLRCYTFSKIHCCHLTKLMPFSNMTLKKYHWMLSACTFLNFMKSLSKVTFWIPPSLVVGILFISTWNFFLHVCICLCVFVCVYLICFLQFFMPPIFRIPIIYMLQHLD